MPPGKKLNKLCRTAIVPGALRVPRHEPIKLADGSSSARLALDPAKRHASATSAPSAAKLRIPRFHIFSCLRLCTRNRQRENPLPLNKYIFELLGLGKDFREECDRTTSEGLKACSEKPSGQPGLYRAGRFRFGGDVRLLTSVVPGRRRLPLFLPS